ncbi:hypothetical protein AMS68_001537 [Peltaster fructicola]|uniref:Myb-like domain-containing protein n=1 Tax=Peltaster fructicola TaxID=286661 RepID=A0A6H0XNF6_9PEZI|nr:hypothetical protein AMS68_001537 [Peltaster fructicola]
MSDTKKGKIGWTDTEKLGLILQIVAKSGKIPWDELELPEGRTQKACQVMLDKEKTKVKQASSKDSNSNNEDGSSAEKSPSLKSTAKKRKASEFKTPEKKAKTPRAGKKGKTQDDSEVEVENEIDLADVPKVEEE